MNRYLKIIFTTTLLCLSTMAQSAQEAVVRSEYAIIYADTELNAPIGKVRRGTTVMVGEVERKQGQILPISVSGRIAWIKVDDITLKSDQNYDRFKEQFLEHDMDTQFKSALDRLSENNYLVFSYGLSTLETEWEEFLEEIGTTSPTNTMSQFRLFFEHRTPGEKYNWGVGLSYFSTSSHEGQAQFRGVFLEALISRIIIDTGFFSLEINGGGLLSGSSETLINTTDAFYVDKGTAWGYRAGMVSKILPYSRYGLYLGIHYEWINSTTFDEFEGRVETFKLDRLRGVSAIIGFSYKL